MVAASLGKGVVERALTRTETAARCSRTPKRLEQIVGVDIKAAVHSVAVQIHTVIIAGPLLRVGQHSVCLTHWTDNTIN